MNDFERSHFKIFADTKRSAVDDYVRNNLRQPTTKVGRLENILKDSANILPGALVRIKPQRAIPKIQGANVIKTKDVIGMTMSDEDGVEVPQTNFQSLLSKITRRVDDDCLTGMFDQNRHAQSLIAWIVRSAGFAIAGD